jgi:hypothetical protein
MSRRSCQEINDHRMTGTGRPAYDEGTTEQRDGKKTTEQSPRGRRERQDDRNQRRRPRRKEDTMKNSTFDQIINANLASIDPGFGQFALAKASSDLLKKALNK